jgi:ketosteroid isomerase-like protein
MAEEIAKKFIDALHKLEADRDLETIAALFDESAEVSNVLTKDRPMNARDFWQSYRDNFDTIKSTFRNEIITEERAALEWISEGTSSDGNEFKYDGVSILEISGEKITRFQAYFDPNNLGQQIVDEKSAEANG